MTVRTVLCLGCVAFGVCSVFVHGLDVPVSVTFIGWAAFVIDDWLADDDRPGRKRLNERVCLRMPKLLRLRPAERWNTAGLDLG